MDEILPPGFPLPLELSSSSLVDLPESSSVSLSEPFAFESDNHNSRDLSQQQQQRQQQQQQPQRRQSKLSSQINKRQPLNNANNNNIVSVSTTEGQELVPMDLRTRRLIVVPPEPSSSSLADDCSDNNSRTADSDELSSPAKQQKRRFVDLSSYVVFPLHIAARKLGLTKSTLHRRWRQAAGKRKWPYRDLKMIDSKLQNLVLVTNGSVMTPSVSTDISQLVQQRRALLTPVRSYV